MDRPESNVKAIFIAALDQEPGTVLAAYLDAACGDDADLRRRVEALLAAQERAYEVLGPAGEQAGETGRPTDELTPQSEPAMSQPSITDEYRSTAGPDVLIAGRYALQQKIGEGGMGEVWVAKQTEPVKRKVALKLIKTGMGFQIRASAIRAGAPGSGDDGPSEYRPRARRWPDTQRSALLRDGAS